MSNEVDYKKICQSTLGDELETADCGALATVMQAHEFKDGELLVTEGQKDDSLILLVEGRVAVINKTDGEEEVVYTMHEGECAGTRAFVDRTPRKATLKAVGPATVYTMKPDAFESLLDHHPRIVYKVMRALFRITHANLMRMNKETEELARYIHKTGGRY